MDVVKNDKGEWPLPQRTLVEKHLESCGTGSVRVNKLNGGVTTLNRCDSSLSRNESDLHNQISRILQDDFDQIVIKRIKIGYSLQVERTIRP